MGTKTKRDARPALPLPPGVNALLNTRQVCLALGSISGSLLRKWIRAGQFPPSESPEGEDPKWRVATVNAWVESRYGRGA